VTTICPTCGSALGKPLAATKVALHFGHGDMREALPAWTGTLEQFWAKYAGGQAQKGPLFKVS